MKIGAENKKSVIAMVVLLAIAIPLIFYETKGVFWGTNASAAPSISVPAPPTRPGALLAQDGSDPRLRTDILEASRKVRYEAGGRNIFTMEAEIPKADVPVRQRPPVGPPAPTPTPPPPPPPPIPIKYYGFANKPSEPKKVFLQQQGVEQIWVAAQGDVVARRYRVVQITPNTVTMEDVLTGNRQQIPLTAR